MQLLLPPRIRVLCAGPTCGKTTWLSALLVQTNGRILTDDMGPHHRIGPLTIRDTDEIIQHLHPEYFRDQMWHRPLFAAMKEFVLADVARKAMKWVFGAPQRLLVTNLWPSTFERWAPPSYMKRFPVGVHTATLAETRRRWLERSPGDTQGLAQLPRWHKGWVDDGPQCFDVLVALAASEYLEDVISLTSLRSPPGG